MPAASTTGEGALDVVVVDDHPMWRDTMVQVIQRYEVGRVVAQAGDGEEALAVLTTTRPDVVVMDVDMPGMDGVGVTQALRDQGIDTKILFLSSFDEQEKVVGAVRAGASGYLLKTAGAAEVAKAITRIAEGDLVFPPHLTQVLLAEIRQGGAQSRQATPATGSGRPAAPVLSPPPTGGPAPAEGARPDAAVVHTIPDGSIVRAGDLWELEFDGTSAHIGDLKGVGYLATLIAAGGREVMALDLMMRPSGTSAGASSREDGLEARGAGLGPMLDDTAKRAYRARIRDLQEEIEEAVAFNDDERAARARLELEQLTTQLSAAVGLGGRDRPTSSDSERARVAVTRSIRRAIDKIGDVHPALAAHLDANVTTGTFCAYQGRATVRWQL